MKNDLLEELRKLIIMNIKIILYIIIVPLTIWAIEGINIEKILKKNRFNQARIIYILVALSLSYLVVNFLYDFYLSSNII